MSSQPSIVQYTGVPRAPEPVPLARAAELGIRRVIDQHGAVVGDLPEPDLSRDELRKIYESMVLVRAIDEHGWRLQRSGRIMFWIPLRGQEASQVGAVMATKPEDWIFRGHRELAIWFMRGASLEMMFAQFFGAENEPLHGRRLPCLVGNRSINLVSSTTQVGAFITHAAGAAWAARLMGSPLNVLCFFGDGGTSRGEFHSAMNFAGIHRPRIVFVCVNNSWAVTTPMSCQTAQPDLASKGAAYAVRSVRVDGNDPLAVYAVTRDALDRIDQEGATLIETVTYRLGFHTSSDNPDLYRQPAEAEQWAEWDPIRRTRLYLERRGYWSEADESAWLARCDSDIKAAIAAAEAMPLPDAASQFGDIFAESNWMLDAQRARLVADLGGEGA